MNRTSQGRIFPAYERGRTMLASHNHHLRAELDQHELAALHRYVVAFQQDPHSSNPRVEMDRIFRGLEGQIFVPVTVSGERPDAHLAMLMEHKAEQLYKQSGCRFVLVQRMESDPRQQSYVWAEGGWRTVP